MNGAPEKRRSSSERWRLPPPALADIQEAHNQDRRLFKLQMNTSIGYTAQQIILSVFVQTKIQNMGNPLPPEPPTRLLECMRSLHPQR